MEHTYKTEGAPAARFTPPKRPLLMFEEQSRDALQKKMQLRLNTLPRAATEVAVQVTSPSVGRWIGTITYLVPGVRFVET